MRTSLLVAVACCVLAGSAGASAPGAVWVPTLQATQGFDKLSAFPNGVAYAQYADSYARSEDFGETWRVMPRPPRAYLGSPGIRFATPDVGWSYGADAPLDPDRSAEEIRRCGAVTPLYRTADAGGTWSPVCVPGRMLVTTRFQPSVSPLAAWRDGRSLVVTGVEPGGPCGTGVVYATGDAGGRWTRAALPDGYRPGFRATYHDARTIALVAYRSLPDACQEVSDRTAVFVSRDAGRSYRRVLACEAQPLCTAVAFATGSRIVVGRTDGSTLVSRDGGATWLRGQRLASPSNDELVARGAASPWMFWVQAVSFADAAHGFASTRGAGTWRTTDGGMSWRQERSPECVYSQFGVGEIAAASADRAITGGPVAISARVPLADAPDGCGVQAGNVAAGAAPVAPGLLADGRLVPWQLPSR